MGGVSTTGDRKHGCHWDYVCGPNRGSTAPKTMVWICEYPYRTVRLDGPCDDCKCQTETAGTTGNDWERAGMVGTVGGDGVYGNEIGRAGRAVAPDFTPRVLPFRDNR